jgi:hypothetical protein
MSFEKTRLFYAKPLHALEGRDAARPAAPVAPREVVSDADEPTRFLAVERLLEQRGLIATELPLQPAPLEDTDLLDDTELREALGRATWIGRARSMWRSLSLVSRLSLALLALAAVLPFTPRLFAGVRASAPAAPADASERAAAAAGAQSPAAPSTAALVATDPVALAGRAPVSPRAAADAVAQGRCREAVALYRELHLRHPTVDVYREAARILQEQHVGCSEGK